MAISPRLLLFAGPNGSGKSTVTTPQRLTYFGIAPERYINADEIAKALPTEMPDATQEEREREAFRRARTLRSAYRQERESFAFETVFSHPSTLMDMRRCRDAGFEIVVFIVTTQNAEINVARVGDRVKTGGHAVPEDRIRSRYERTMRLLPRIVEDSDTAYVMDNSASVAPIFQWKHRRFTEPTDSMPSFLVKRLAEPLDARSYERGKIAHEFGAVPEANEETGEYTGAIVWRGDHYAVQETPDGLVQHDGLLFDALPQTGETTTVRYKDNAATDQK